MGISVGHVLVVLLIVVLLFGTKHLRNLGGDLGNAIKGFKDAMRSGENDSDKPPIGKLDNQTTSTGGSAHDAEVKDKDKDKV